MGKGVMVNRTCNGPPKNKANLGREFQVTLPFQYSIIPPFQSDADCATSPRCPASGNKPNSSIADCGFWIADSERPAARRLGLRGPIVQTRRPRQKSPSWVSTRVSGPISQVGSVEPDFCRVRQTNPICLAGPGGPPSPLDPPASPPPSRLCQTRRARQKSANAE
jgi:hypothetical protein